MGIPWSSQTHLGVGVGLGQGWILLLWVEMEPEKQGFTSLFCFSYGDSGFDSRLE